MKRFAVFDIDGTLVRWQLFHTVVTELASSGQAELTELHQMEELHAKWRRREDDEAFHTYEAASLAAWFALMKHTTQNDFTNAIDAAFDAHKDFVYRYTRSLVQSLKKRDYTLIAISGSHQQVVDKIGDHYGFDYALGSVYPIDENGAFTGAEVTPVFDKGAALQKIVKKLDLSWQESYAVGDSRSDAKMLALVAHPIAFNPDRNLLQIARSKNWKIVVERKNVIYELSAQNGTYILD